MSAPAAFVAGWPVAHSRSPLIHRTWLQRYGIAGDYRLEAVEPERFPAFLEGMAAYGYVGGNVTLPHKEAAFRACAEPTEIAARLGAANTLWLRDGTLCGDNTDVYGFTANLDVGAPSWRRAEQALVLGAGGASRAVLHALLEAGISRIVVANRTVTRAEGLADLFGDRVVAAGLDAVPEIVPEAKLIVNTTSAGLKGEGELAVDWAAAPADAIVTDIVYVPLVTPFLRAAAARGLTIVDGLGMLLHQAVPGFERWFGVRPEVDAALRDRVVADLAG